MAEREGVFIHPQAICESPNVGPGTRIWAFAHVLKGARIGSRVNICDHCFVENDVVIGDNVVIKNGVAVWNGVTIEDGAFLGPNVALTNELWPRSGFPKGLARTMIRRGATIGANATIVTGITLGECCTIGAGSVVTKDVPPYALMVGSPARRKGWVCVCGLKLAFGEKETASCLCGREYREGDGAVELLKG
jgi:acetyltransferase-like isoleucine patch superfamily enzyme